MQKATPQNNRNLRWQKLPIALKPFNSVVLSFIEQTYGGQPNAAKRLARAADATPRAADNWLAGLNAPSGDRLADLVAAHPELEDAIRRNIHERRARLRQRSAAAVETSRARLAARGQ